MDALPTKKNLILAKTNLTLARKGHDLLELKQNALTLELKRTEKIANELREEVKKLFLLAEHALTIAKMENGEKICELLETNTLNNFFETTAASDEAFFTREMFLSKESELKKIEETLSQLKIRVKRTKKRVSALRNIAIPMYETRVKYISNQLEEHERDEMIRLKTAREFHPAN
ncbi:MAG: hypothetical protein LBI27_02910 [Clostridiales bacterium]|jgi:V/A-type H+-transporting ATPase subunit D|nr:hypothetical protein [Clostridiales bacterium]